MKRILRAAQFWSVLLFASAVLCAVLMFLQHAAKRP